MCAKVLMCVNSLTKRFNRFNAYQQLLVQESASSTTLQNVLLLQVKHPETALQWTLGLFDDPIGFPFFEALLIG